MKSLLLICTVAALSILSSAALEAAEPAASISSGRLSAMGFGAMQALSDAEGHAVRGEGVSGRVWGTPNGYNKPLAPNFAIGRNLVINGNVFAGGGSVAFAR